jgi:hypothetical protein
MGIQTGKHLSMRISSIACLFACGVLAATLSPAPSWGATDEVAEINNLVRQGNTAQALQRIDAYLASNPRDVRMRFQKGLLLTDRGSIPEAIVTFTALTRDHPDIPEPYNNLAVLHASRGDYDQARAALENAIRLNPNYAMAYENLGDIHAKLASRAYEKSRDLDRSNTVSQTKIDVIKGLFVGQAGASAAKGDARKPEPAKVATAPASKTEAAPPAASAKGKAADEAKPAAQPSAAPASAAAASTDGTAEVVATVKRWAEAWTKQDASAYLAFYAPEFKIPGGEPRERWEATRRSRIEKPRRIEVTVGDPKVSAIDKNRAEVSFRQHYRSESINERSNKTMVLTKNDRNWLIVEEQASR